MPVKIIGYAFAEKQFHSIQFNLLIYKNIQQRLQKI